jgi:hypothetical protein
MKGWSQQNNINLIEKNNPKWIDLYDKVHYYYYVKLTRVIKVFDMLEVRPATKTYMYF